MALWTRESGWEVARMSNRTVYMENGQPLSDELLSLSAEQFELIERKEEITDAKFRTESVSYGKDVLRRFLHDRVTVVAAIIVLFIVFMGIVGPYMSGRNYLTQDRVLTNMPPRIPVIEKLGIFDGTQVLTIRKSSLEEYGPHIKKNYGEIETVSAFGKGTMYKVKVDMYSYKGVADQYFWFGSDNLGRDIFSRLWQGTRISLILAVAVVIVNLTVGLIVGAICGYYGGWIDLIIQRIMDIIWNIPSLPLTILLIMLFGSGILPLVLAFCLTGWMGNANAVRMQFYRYKGREYVLASRTMGASDIRLMFRHILPNAVGTLITGCALSIPSVVFQEAGLAYLGLGVQAPNPSIGMLLSDGQKVLLDYPTQLVFPGIVIVLLMLAFNLLGNGLRDAFNPSLRQ